MKPPVPRVWFGLAFFFGIAATLVMTRPLESWTALVAVSQTVPLGTQCVLLTLELMLFAVAVGDLVDRSKQAPDAREDARSPILSAFNPGFEAFMIGR